MRIWSESKGDSVTEIPAATDLNGNGLSPIAELFEVALRIRSDNIQDRGMSGQHFQLGHYTVTYA